MNTHVSPPPLDAATAVLLPLSTSRPPQDWERLVSPGHVLKERLLAKRTLPFAVALVAFVLMFGAGFLGGPIARLLVPINPAAIAFDPDHYVEFSSGVSTSYRLAWLGDVPSQQGMTADAWRKLVAAVRTDVDAHGIATDDWTATVELPTAPRITRPEKAFQSDKLAALSTGVVTIPAEFNRASTIDVIGFVDGQNAWFTLSRGGCVVFFGPEMVSCEGAYALEDHAVDHLVQFKPAPLAAAKAGE